MILNLSMFFMVAAGILLILMGAFRLADAEKKMILTKKEKTGFKFSFFDKMLDKNALVGKFENKADALLSLYDIKTKTARNYTKLVLLCGVIGLFVAMYLRNVFVAPLLVLVFAYFPIWAYSRSIKLKRVLYNKQVYDFLQLFVTDYTTSQSVQKTLLNVCDKIPNPLRNEYERLLRMINSGVPISECFLKFAKRTQNQWILYFSQVMIMFFRNGGDFVPHLTSIIRMIAAEKIFDEHNATELSALKAVNTVLIALVPVSYIAGIIVSPDTEMIFTQTAMGRLIILGAAISCLFSMVVGKWIIDN